MLGGEVDGRADIYAIGCVAHWLLTGQFVFTAETSMALLMQHAHKPAGTAIVADPAAYSQGTR
jgi:serine/threonine-protein kinase